MTSTAAPQTGPSPFLSAPGAILAEEGRDAGVAAHYGNPLAEQRRLDEGLALVDLSHRGIVEVRGEDRLTWLNSITSGALDRLEPGASTETLFLDPQGRIEHAAGVIDDGVSTWLLVEADSVAPLMAWLLKMRFRARAEILDRGADLARVGFLEREGSDLAARVGAAAPNGHPLRWSDPWSGVTPGGWQYSRAAQHPGEIYAWREALVERAALPGLAAEVPLAGILAAEALRIAAWRPRQATEVDEKSIPHESDWLRSAVHLDKGCYRGQETVAKVHNLGHPPRRLVLLDLDGSEGFLPEPGDAVWAVRGDEPRVVGAVTAAALHYEFGPIALGLIRRAVDPAIALSVEHNGQRIAAGQEVIVPSDAGAVADIPRLPRIGSRPASR